ncbi:MAG TPA: D-glycero-beta-D-manno-heptose-7-phosphate kinase [Blastocatellia bacterium]|jgi:D-beta-D-heptose 7-phosphate kinase/D-beta-D-heptose 1-phosphate adenosyltransferase
MMDYQRAQQIVGKFPDLRIVTVGDLMLDEFIWGQARRISPEAPTPVVEVKRETWHPGGAANVVSNLLELGARAIPIGVVGADDAARLLRDRFAERNAGIDGVITDASRPTTRKTRVVAHSGRQYQQIVRADREDRSPVSDVVEDRIIAAFNQSISNADAVIVSDYDKGLLTPRVLRALIESARSRTKMVCLDPKIRNFSLYREVDVITPNQSEAERASGVEITDELSLGAAARRIRELTECKNVLITRGELGMSLLGPKDDDEEMTHIPTTAREIYDVTGAGDTVIATLALALAAGAGLNEAAIIANHAAGVVVGKVGVTAVSRDELLAALKTR